MQFLHDGKLGKITVARGLCYKPRGSIGKVNGTAEAARHGRLQPLVAARRRWSRVMRKQFHYDWHWIWDYGNGDLGNQGIHEMDKCPLGA